MLNFRAYYRHVLGGNGVCYIWMDVVYLSGWIIHDLRILASVWKKVFWLNVPVEFTNLNNSKEESTSIWIWELPSRELIYPTLGNVKSSSNLPWEKDILIPRRVLSSLEIDQTNELVLWVFNFFKSHSVKPEIFPKVWFKKIEQTWTNPPPLLCPFVTLWTSKFCTFCLAQQQRQGFFSHISNSTTPQKFNSSPLKNDGWKTSFLLGLYIFRGYVKLQVGSLEV